MEKNQIGNLASLLRQNPNLGPKGFYMSEKYGEFIKQNNVKEYKNNLCNRINDFSWGKDEFNFDRVCATVLNKIFDEERKFLSLLDINGITPQNITVQEEGLNIKDLIGTMRNYEREFNQQILFKLFGLKLGENQKNIASEEENKHQKGALVMLDYIDVDADETDWLNFVAVLNYISKTGGFKTETVRKYLTRNEFNKNLFLSAKVVDEVLNNNQDNINPEVLKLSIDTLNEVIKKMIDEKNWNNKVKSFGRKILTKNSKTNENKKAMLKDIIDNNYEKIVIQPLKDLSKNFINSRKIDEDKKNKIIKILDYDNHWNKYQERLKDKIDFFDITYYGQNRDVTKITNFDIDISGTSLKGDYGEFFTSVIPNLDNIDISPLGSKSSGMISSDGVILTSQVQGGVDEILTIKKDGKEYKYGIQDKELNLIKLEDNRYKIDRELYANKNLNIKIDGTTILSNNKVLFSRMINLLPKDDLELLATLVELYNEDHGDDRNISKILSTMDSGQLRIFTYSGVSDKEIEWKNLTNNDIIFTPIFRISGYFIPASSILFDRLYHIIESIEYTIINKSITRTFYQFEGINTDRRDSILKQYDQIHDLTDNEVFNAFYSIKFKNIVK